MPRERKPLSNDRLCSSWTPPQLSTDRNSSMVKLFDLLKSFGENGECLNSKSLTRNGSPTISLTISSNHNGQRYRDVFKFQAFQEWNLVPFYTDERPRCSRFPCTCIVAMGISGQNEYLLIQIGQNTRKLEAIPCVLSACSFCFCRDLSWNNYIQGSVWSTSGFAPHISSSPLPPGIPNFRLMHDCQNSILWMQPDPLSRLFDRHSSLFVTFPLRGLVAAFIVAEMILASSRFNTLTRRKQC